MPRLSEREGVEAAIRAAGGNLSRAAGIMGCSRQTLYQRIYRHGLERLAGINLAKREELDMREQSLRIMKARPPIEAPITASVRLPEDLWKRAKIAAIRRGVRVSEIVQGALEAALPAEEGAEEG